MTDFRRFFGAAALAGGRRRRFCGHFSPPGGRFRRLRASERRVFRRKGEQLERQGISAEVIDLRTIRPIDRETVFASVEKTSRLVCVYEAVKTLGIGAEISAMVAESHAFDFLDAPILRLGGTENPIPYNPDLEKASVPQVDDIVTQVADLVKGNI